MRLGDLLETIFKYTGIKWLVKKVTEAVGIEDCGCEDRKQALNKIKIDRKYGSTRPTKVGEIQRKKEK
jgi:hypothetical protein